MCNGMLPGQQLMNFKPAANVVNQTPIGMLYKATNKGKKAIDGIKDGSAFGLAGAAMNQANKKSNSFGIA